jgi:hypothetical protein
MFSSEFCLKDLHHEYFNCHCRRRKKLQQRVEKVIDYQENVKAVAQFPNK